MNKSILYIWDSDYPWDVRAEKICRSLINHGYRVHLAARNLKRRPLYENIHGLHVHRIRTWANDKLNYALSFPAFFSPIWRRFIRGIIRKYDIRLVIVRDLPLAPLGINCAKAHGIPCILDMAEDYVAMIRDIWNARKFQGLNLVVRNPYLAKLVERYSFKNADHIFVVVNEAIDVVVRGGGSAGKVTVVSNTPELDKIDRALSAGVASPLLDKIRNHFSAIYVGGIQMGRGIQTVLDAIPKIVERIPDFLFVVVGDGYASDHFRKIIQDRQLQDHVLWVGWVAHEEIYQYIQACNIGIIPHLVTDHVNTTIPNKVFDYMGLALPVLSSDSVPLKRILEQESAGICFRSGDATDLAGKCTALCDNNVNYGQNGRNAVISHYNWAIDENRLLAVTNKVIFDKSVL